VDDLWRKAVAAIADFLHPLGYRTASGTASPERRDNALKRLIANIEAGQIDVVVVYKADRLTRALSDFAKLVDVFDRRGVSFVRQDWLADEPVGCEPVSGRNSLLTGNLQGIFGIMAQLPQEVNLVRP
jgi:hypothetical protein